METNNSFLDRGMRLWFRVRGLAFRLLHLVWDFLIYGFSNPRIRWLMLVGSPLFAIITCLALLLAFPEMMPRGWLIQRYESAAMQATKDGRHAEAQLLLRKLIELAPDVDHFRYLLGKNLQREQPVQALHVMVELAPGDGLGYAPAHLWQAMVWARFTDESLVKLGLDPDMRLQQIRHHCSMVLRTRPGNREAKRLIAETQALQDPLEAISTLQTLTEQDPEALLRIAQLHRALENREQAEAALRALSELLQRRLRNPPFAELEVALYLGSLLDTDRADEATQWLQNHRLDLPTAVYQRNLSTIYAAAARQHFETANANGFDEGVRSLVLAFRTDPNNPLCYQTLTEHMCTDETRVAKAIEICEQLIAEARSGTSVFIILGSLLVMTDDPVRAEMYFEQAFALEPQNVVVLNNLAWLIAHKPEPDLVRAEQLINEAVRRAPQNPEIRETYGCILLLRNRVSEALVEFQFALQAAPDNPKYLQRCAEGYERLGNSVQAEAFRERARSAAIEEAD